MIVVAVYAEFMPISNKLKQQRLEALRSQKTAEYEKLYKEHEKTKMDLTLKYSRFLEKYHDEFTAILMQ